MMRTIEIVDGRPVVGRRPIPEPGPGEVLVKVAASGINRADLAQREGRYPPPPGASDILGLEISGEVDRLGPGVTGFAVGTPVCALLAGGGYAEYCAVPAVQVAPAPAGLSMVEAAAIIETACTVWDNVWGRARLAAGERLLVHGGGSGIGVTAIQLARALGHPVIVTAGSAEKCQRCLAIGADRAVNYREEDFVEAARSFSDGQGVDVILDLVGGPYLARNLQALAPEGRLSVISVGAGAVGEADLRLMMQRRLTLTASTLRARAPAVKGRVVAGTVAAVWPLIAAGRVKPIIDSLYRPLEVDAAHARMKASEHFGKLVIDWSV